MPLSKSLQPTQAAPLDLDNRVFATTPAPPVATWDVLYKWAGAEDLLPPVMLLCDATAAVERPGAVGSILHYIVKPGILNDLELWADENAHAGLLWSLAHRLAVAGQHVLEHYRPLPDALPARARFEGGLDTQYLYALLATRNPYASGDTVGRAGYDRLRLWLLVHALERAERGILLDSAVREVATRLRLAGDGKAAWLDILNSLRLTARDPYALDAQICVRVAVQLRSEQLESSARAFLRALSQVALREDHAAAGPLRGQLFDATLWHTRIEQLHAAAPVFPALLYDNDDASSSGLELVGGRDDDLVCVSVPQDATLAGQVKYASSILLSTLEENQFLSWTWSRLTPGELHDIQAWIATALKTSAAEDQLLAAVVWIAINTGRSLARVLAMRLSDSAGEEWSIASSGALLRASARPSRGWSPTDDQARWVRALSAHYELRLPEEVAGVFAAGIERLLPVSPTVLGDLLPAQVLSSRFREVMQEVAPRVTAGMLANVLPSQLYTTTKDAILARLYARHPQTGLPGAAAYPSWTGSELAATLRRAGLPVPVLDGALSTSNVLGSRLDPIESLLRREIRRAAHALRHLRGKDVFQYHNALTSYLVVALHAASGARPIRAPFETLRDFDLDAGTAFVADKVSGASRSGRLVPLPRRLCSFLAEQYLPYLRSLGLWIERSGDSELGRRVVAVTTRDGTPSVPLFFMLRLDGKSLEWEPCSEAGIANAGVFTWPLPLRHLRHRLARQLRSAELNPEIIDGLLGHAERGSAAYGDRSERVWLEDMTAARPALESCFASLGFRPVRISRHLESTPLENLVPRVADQQGPVLFGRAERAIRRRERLRGAVQGARMMIETVCDGRQIGELTTDEIDQLSRALVFNPNGIPHALGSLRYAVFLRQLERAQERQLRPIRMRRVYLAFTDEPSAITPMACGAYRTYQRLANLMSLVPEPAYLPRALGQALALGVLRLVLESRLTDGDALRDILAGENYRVIGFRDRTYIELGEKIAEAGPDALCRRLEISQAAARLLAAGLTGKRANNAGKRTIDQNLHPLVDCIQGHSPSASGIANVEQLVLATARLVDQVNAVSRPGIVAGYLAGRVKSLSLNWYDFTRLQDGHVRDFGYLVKEADSPQQKEMPAASVSLAVNTSVGPDRRQQANRKLIGAIVHLLGEKEGSRRLARDERAVGIRELVAEAVGEPGSMVCLLAHWAAHLLTRQNQHRDQYLSLSTVERYLCALSKYIVELAPDIEIEELDEDEITEVYASIIDDVPPKSQRYSRLRLEEFHDWLLWQKSVEEPDWSLVAGADKSLNANPGVVSEAEYLRVFSYLEKSAGDETAKLAALLLLFAYRFGLRVGESLGLLRKDIVGDPEFGLIVIVRNNKLRKLKTNKSSRRLVPLLADLDEREVKLIRNMMAKAEAQGGGDSNYPVFGIDATNIERRKRRVFASRLRKLLIPLLRVVTGNSRANVHHARHSAGNVIAASVFGVDELGLSDCESTSINTIKNILLGSSERTRRALPAVERYLGHADAGTTQEYYLHILDCWSNQYNALDAEKEVRLAGVKYLDDAPASCAVILAGAERQQVRSLTVADSLMYLRLRARGFARDVAADALDVDENVAELIDKRLDNMAGRFRFSASERAFAPSMLEMYPSLAQLITRFSDSVWDEWIDWARKRWCVAKIARTSHLYSKITTSRQLVLWTAEDLEAAKYHLNWWGIGNEQLLAVHSPRCSSKLISTAQSYGLEVKDCKKSSPAVQIDTVRCGDDGQFTVDHRLAILVRETDHPIRHGAEFLMSIVLGEIVGGFSRKG